MNILIRLSPELVYGPATCDVELLGDYVGLSISDINEAMIAYVEYRWFNTCLSFNDEDFVQEYFMGVPIGYSVVYAVKSQLPEIGAYLPGDMKSLRYLRTIKDGFYLIAERDEHASNLRFDTTP